MNIPASPRGRHCILHLSLSLPAVSSPQFDFKDSPVTSASGGAGARDKARNMPSARRITHLWLFYVLITFSAAEDGRQMRPWRFRSWEVTGVACVPRWRGLDICSSHHLDLLPNVIVVCTNQERKRIWPSRLNQSRTFLQSWFHLRGWMRSQLNNLSPTCKDQI